jgi:hypothetical protein
MKLKKNKFCKCLLAFSSKTDIFPSTLQNTKDQDMQHNSSDSCVEWVWHVTEECKLQVFEKQSARSSVWT